MCSTHSLIAHCYSHGPVLSLLSTDNLSMFCSFDQPADGLHTFPPHAGTPAGVGLEGSLKERPTAGCLSGAAELEKPASRWFTHPLALLATMLKISSCSFGFCLYLVYALVGCYRRFGSRCEFENSFNIINDT